MSSFYHDPNPVPVDYLVISESDLDDKNRDGLIEKLECSNSMEETYRMHCEIRKYCSEREEVQMKETFPACAIAYKSEFREEILEGNFLENLGF